MDWYELCLQQLEQLMIENQDVLWRMGHEWRTDDENDYNSVLDSVDALGLCPRR